MREKKKEKRPLGRKENINYIIKYIEIIIVHINKLFHVDVGKRISRIKPKLVI